MFKKIIAWCSRHWKDVSGNAKWDWLNQVWGWVMILVITPVLGWWKTLHNNDKWAALCLIIGVVLLIKFHLSSKRASSHAKPAGKPAPDIADQPASISRKEFDTASMLILAETAEREARSLEVMTGGRRPDKRLAEDCHKACESSGLFEFRAIALALESMRCGDSIHQTSSSASAISRAASALRQKLSQQKQ